MTILATMEAPVPPADRRRARETALASQAGWLFDAQAGQLLTVAALAGIGLPPGPLAGVRLMLVRVAQAGRWHLALATTPCCPRLARAIEQGRAVRTVIVGLLEGTSLCRWCARRLAVPGLIVPGPEGACLALAQYLAAAHAWVTGLEAAALSADWLACSRWAVRTPFTGPSPLPDLLAALPAGSPWAGYATAAEATWEQLSERASTAREQARQAAGPPGYQAMAACARAVAGASPATRAESCLLDAIASLPVSAGAWTIASAAWLHALATGAGTDAADAALATALDDRYRNAQVRDVTLLTRPATTSPGEYGSLADWARAEHQALRHQTARQWSQRLTGCLASVLAQGDDSDWQLLRIAGWPFISELNRDLAYLAAYPELARAPDPDCGYSCGRDRPCWVVVLHVPGFAATHAALHDGIHLDITPGPPLPAHATPSPGQLRALLKDTCEHDPIGKG